MPLYGVSPALMATAARPNVLFAAETPGTGSASQQVCLPPSPVGGSKHFSIEYKFSADPGAFSIDVQTADTDVAANYVTTQTITTGMNASFAGRVELTNIIARYARIVLVTRTNSVTLTASLFTP